MYVCSYSKKLKVNIFNFFSWSGASSDHQHGVHAAVIHIHIRRPS
jgi:hypothetical protein